MSDNPTDFYHQKTDAELLFFVEHPEYYQPSLVAAARRELRRRGVAPTAPVAHPANILPVGPMETPAATGLRTGPLTLGLAVLLLLSVGAYYFVKQRNRPAPVADAPPARKAPPRLMEVETSVIPDYGLAVKASVQRQVQRVPAAERAVAAKGTMPMHQYRELAKRFWTAEFQTEYVLERARRGKVNAALPGHVEATLATWQQWNKVTVYSYKFGPRMTQHFDAMSRVARQQQEGLADLLLVAHNPQPYETAKTRQRDADVNDLLSSLLATSPVTGRPYTPLVRRVRL